jgi:hypothetical protein
MVMEPGLTVLASDTATWGIVIAGLALVVSVYGALLARRSAKAAGRSANAAEETAKATVAAAEASGRSASAAETSAQHAGRSADAAERTAVVGERGVELEEERVRHEQRERAARDAPRWEPTGEDEGAWWISDDNHLRGVLVNVSTVRASVTRVELNLPTGGALVGLCRAEPPGPISGGLHERLDVPAGMAMAIEFSTDDGSLGTGLQGNVAPRVEITARGDELDWEGTHTIELLRRGGGVTEALRWQARPIR